jgi:hypothetical protein
MFSRLTIIPCDLDEANAYILQHHRHHGKARGHKFSLAVVDADAVVRGVAIVGRPVARAYNNGLTLEVTRLATDGARNACSCLYGAARRATFALGYRRLVTYILLEEGGASLRAAGWKCIGEAGGGTWNREDRPRVDKHPTQRKLCWECLVVPVGV